MTKFYFTELPLLKQVVVRYRCSACLLLKHKLNFTKDASRRNGIRAECNKCRALYCEAYRKTKVGLITSIYNSQKSSSKRRCHPAPSYSRVELITWCLSQSLFHKLYNEWVSSSYAMLSIPSIDRLDDYKPYSFDNIQLITWQENKKKGHLDEVVGRNKKKSKIVNQYDLNGNLIATYHSTRHASRVTGVRQSGISGVCSGKPRKKGCDANGVPRFSIPKIAGGYVWKFA